MDTKRNHYPGMFLDSEGIWVNDKIGCFVLSIFSVSVPQGTYISYKTPLCEAKHFWVSLTMGMEPMTLFLSSQSCA